MHFARKTVTPFAKKISSAFAIGWVMNCAFSQQISFSPTQHVVLSTPAHPRLSPCMTNAPRLASPSRIAVHCCHSYSNVGGFVWWASMHNGTMPLNPLTATPPWAGTMAWSAPHPAGHKGWECAPPGRTQGLGTRPTRPDTRGGNAPYPAGHKGWECAPPGRTQGLGTRPTRPDTRAGNAPYPAGHKGWERASPGRTQGTITDDLYRGYSLDDGGY